MRTPCSYANVLLFVLNSRERIAADEVRCNTSDIELSTMHISVASPNITIPASVAGDPKRRAGFTSMEEDPVGVLSDGVCSRTTNVYPQGRQAA